MFSCQQHEFLSFDGDVTLKKNLPRILTAGRCALWKWEIEAQRLFIAPAFYQMLGYETTAAGIAGYRLEEYIHPEDLPRIENLAPPLTQGNNAFPFFEFRVFTKKGNILWFSCRGKIITCRGDGRAVSAAGTFTDVTQARKINTGTAKRYRMLERLVENLPGMAYRSVPDGKGWRIVFASKGVNKLLGYNQAHFLENVDGIYKNLVAEADYQRIWEETHQAIREKRPHQMYYRVRTVFGDYKWVWEQGMVLFSKYGQPVAMEGFIADVTQQKELEIALSKENLRLKSSHTDRYHFGDIIGKSPVMRQLYEMMEKAAQSDASTIIYGESGTGKELVARMIHNLSHRSEKPFITVNCGAIPDNLMESEFFGYKKGAFSGADTDKKGYFSAAEGGSLFLDELGELSLNFQVKLLRILEGYGYSPLGGTELFTSDIRFIAATNQDLMAMINENRMREDFFFRVHIIPITLPPLRERREDIPLLIDHFLEKFGHFEEGHKGVAEELSIALKGYDWPGNVRELQNTIQRYVTLGELKPANGKSFCVSSPAGSRCTPFLPPGDENSDISLMEADGLSKAMAQHEKQLIIAALEQNRWNRQKTALMLKIGERSLYRKMKLHGIT